MELRGKKVYLRLIEPDEAPRWVELLNRNRESWSAFEPSRDEAFYSLETQRNTIVSDKEDAGEGIAFHWGVFEHGSGSLIGDVSMYGIQRGPFQSVSIGYSMDQDHTGRGYMTEAVRLAVRHAFQDLMLHRVEAVVHPSNTASIRLLEKVGFKREGLARKSLKVQGRWLDHYYYAILEEDW